MDLIQDIITFPLLLALSYTALEPHQLSTGVKWLFVNGQMVTEDGTHKPDVLAGMPLKHDSATK